MEMLLRFGAFLSVFSTMALWEYLRPRRLLLGPRQTRWIINLGLTALNTALVWGTVGGVASAAAVFAAERGVGILHCPATLGSRARHSSGSRPRPLLTACDVPCRTCALAAAPRASRRSRL